MDGCSAALSGRNSEYHFSIKISLKQTQPRHKGGRNTTRSGKPATPKGGHRNQKNRAQKREEKSPKQSPLKGKQTIVELLNSIISNLAARFSVTNFLQFQKLKKRLRQVYRQAKVNLTLLFLNGDRASTTSSWSTQICVFTWQTLTFTFIEGSTVKQHSPNIAFKALSNTNDKPQSNVEGKSFWSASTGQRELILLVSSWTSTRTSP